MSTHASQLQTHEILPGVTLTVLPSDRFKVGSFSWAFTLPLCPEESYTRSLLLSVLRRGCESYPTLSHISRRLDELYATPYHVVDTVKGNCQYVGFSAELLENRYLLDDTDLCGEILSLMRDMLFCPLTDQNGLLCERYVEAEKKNAIDHLRSLQNHPSSYAMARFSDIFYENEPFRARLDGAEERIAAITAEQLTKTWRDMLCHAPVRCFYIGGMPPADVTERVRAMMLAAFEGIDRVVQSIEQRCRIPQAWDEVRRAEETGRVGQSHLILGWRSGVTVQSPDYYAMMLCHEILGLSPISLLFVHVREAHSLCYSCSSVYRIERGDIIVTCGISANNRALAEHAILEQIEVLQRGEFSEAEWQAAKKSLIGSCRQMSDSPRALYRYYELRALLGMQQTLEQSIACFDALTREQVIAAAQKLRLELVYFRRGTDGSDLDVEEDASDD